MIEIGTYNPATITFPAEVKTIMIVNNAAQQPNRTILIDLDNPELESMLSVSADSMAYFFCRSLGKAIAESPIFDDVRLCDDTLRYDSVFLYNRSFSPYDTQLFCDRYDVDALITLDKYYFKTLYAKNTQLGYFNWGMLTIIISGELKVLCPGYNEAMTFRLMDSLLLGSEATIYYEDVKSFTSEEILFGMRYLSEYCGEKMHVKFVPYWDDEERWYYKNFSSEWKRATSYAIAEKWEAAANEWHIIYDRESRWKRKAMLASNLALYYEIAGNFQKAVEYAEVASSIFKKNADENNFHSLRQQKYLEKLTKRAENDEILSRQLRENVEN